MANRPTPRGVKARELIRDMGPTVTDSEVNNRLIEAGLGTINENTFFKLRREIWPKTPHEANGVAHPPAPEPVVVRPPVRPDPEPVQRAKDLDYLERLIRFGLAVEAVGGIVPARRMLDALETLKAEVFAQQEPAQ